MILIPIESAMSIICRVKILQQITYILTGILVIWGDFFLFCFFTCLIAAHNVDDVDNVLCVP